MRHVHFLSRSLAVGTLSLLAHASVTAAAIYTSGHGDLGIAYESGELEPHIHLHDGSVVDGIPVSNPPDGIEFAPDEAIIFVADPSIPRPTGGQWDFLGAASGSPVWILPQGEDPAKPFFGIASEELAASEWPTLSLSLISLDGPAGGHFSVYQIDAFGTPLIKFDTSDGIGGDDTLPLIVGSHDHYNWAFTQPGVYGATFSVNGTHLIDGPKSAAATFSFGVTQVPEPSTTLALGLGVALALGRRRHHSPV